MCGFLRQQRLPCLFDGLCVESDGIVHRHLVGPTQGEVQVEFVLAEVRVVLLGVGVGEVEVVLHVPQRLFQRQGLLAFSVGLGVR